MADKRLGLDFSNFLSFLASNKKEVTLPSQKKVVTLPKALPKKKPAPVLQCELDRIIDDCSICDDIDDVLRIIVRSKKSEGTELKTFITW
ncbi:MAG: hypothetical protein Edafosvirus1_127 [Edafosvirus sp.]|uniref:Uncharacterized protein n=1 Tax=Edafosvirus sp. TaxID=2487765 RepID=A0A3G4ZSC3_9VIRU|nr:MAG: hypothetical protein Edafosvirus1_127 [Edafosvirus sp.]